MKVLYFHQHFSSRNGSSGTRSYEFARKLTQRGHSVTIVCGSYGPAVTGLTSEFRRGVRSGVVDGFEVVEFALPYSNRDSFLKRTMTFARFAMRSIALALFRNYDVVFATSTPLTAGLPGVAAALLRRKTFVFEVRDLWPELPRAMGVISNPAVLFIMSVLEWVSYKTSTACIGLAPGIVDGVRRYKAPPESVFLVPNASDLDIFGSSAGDPWRPSGVGAEDLMAVFAGTHGIANGVDALLDAASELLARGRRDIKIVLVGDGIAKPALVNRAEREGIDNCIFLPTIPRLKLSGLLRSADAGLMILRNVPAFYYGTSPNKFFDYIAAGLPVLNNYPGWVADLIGEHGCGLVVAPDNPSAFASALTQMADNRDALRSMGKNARALAEQKFDREAIADSFVSILEKVAPRG